MLIHECEALAVRIFFETVSRYSAARALHWNAFISTSRGDRRFWRYTSDFCIRGDDGLVTKEACVPLVEDGKCTQTVQSLEQAVLAAVSETALAIRAPVEITTLRPPAA